MKPYYDHGGITIYHGDASTVMLNTLAAVDCVVTDPPYGDTSLPWDQRVAGWTELAGGLTEDLWCFGSFRFWMLAHRDFENAGWRYGQEIVWQKHAGSGPNVDRFSRVHELAVQWYRGAWGDLHRDVPRTAWDGPNRKIRRSAGDAPHRSNYGQQRVWVDDGTRMMQSVIRVRSEHRRALHPTQKPLAILRPLITYSSPPGGVVLDPFMGSGSTLVVARDEGRNAIGIEIEERYCEIAATRLGQEVMDFGEAA